MQTVVVVVGGGGKMGSGRREGRSEWQERKECAYVHEHLLRQDAAGRALKHCRTHDQVPASAPWATTPAGHASRPNKVAPPALFLLTCSTTQPPLARASSMSLAALGP